MELGGTSVSLFMYVEDVDATVKQAVDAGATVTMEVADQFWGDRFGAVTDPYGHLWTIATRVEDVTPEEVAERPRSHGRIGELSASARRALRSASPLRARRVVTRRRGYKRSAKERRM